MDKLVIFKDEINQLLARYGVKFGIYKNNEFHEQLFPFDPIPRVIEHEEFEELEKGLIQRVNALNQFLLDIYTDQKIVKDGVVPVDYIFTSPGFLAQCQGIVPPEHIFAHIAGIDLVKGKDETWYVLEDNLRVPSGASYPMIARSLCRRASPNTFRENSVEDNRNYGSMLRTVMDDVNTGGINVVFTPGRYNAAFFEHSYLAEKTGHKLMIGFNRRYAPVCQKAKAAYGEGHPEVIIAQKNRPATEYRATLENAIHMVDLMRYYGGEVKNVHALTKYSDPYYETFTTAQLEFDNGASGMLIAARCSGQWEETIELHGSNLSAFIKMPDSVTITDAQEQHKTAMTPLAMGWARSEDKLGFTNAIRHFLDCVRDDKKPMTDAADAYKTHELLDRILRSAGLPAMD